MIGKITNNILVPDLTAEPFHSSRQLRQFVNPYDSPASLVSELLQIARALE
jgi:hypothetical protein